jgi:hypothetical protein
MLPAAKGDFVEGIRRNRRGERTIGCGSRDLHGRQTMKAASSTGAARHG